jgi:hypothetical protein
LNLYKLKGGNSQAKLPAFSRLLSLQAPLQMVFILIQDLSFQLFATEIGQPSLVKLWIIREICFCSLASFCFRNFCSSKTRLDFNIVNITINCGGCPKARPLRRLQHRRSHKPPHRRIPQYRPRRLRLLPTPTMSPTPTPIPTLPALTGCRKQGAARPFQCAARQSLPQRRCKVQSMDMIAERSTALPQGAGTATWSRVW